VFFGGDAAFGPKNIIWAVEHGHQAAISIHRHCQGEAVSERLAPGMNLQSRKMGMHEWSYANDYSPVERRLMPHVSLKERFKNLEQPLYVSAGLPQTGRVMVKDEDLCVHCGLCAERCPTAAWDMQKSELHWPLAGDEARVLEARKPKIA